jgi:hypothetical protein
MMFFILFFGLSLLASAQELVIPAVDLKSVDRKLPSSIMEVYPLEGPHTGYETTSCLPAREMNVGSVCLCTDPGLKGRCDRLDDPGHWGVCSTMGKDWAKIVSSLRLPVKSDCWFFTGPNCQKGLAFYVRPVSDPPTDIENLAFVKTTNGNTVNLDEAIESFVCYGDHKNRCEAATDGKTCVPDWWH